MRRVFIVFIFFFSFVLSVNAEILIGEVNYSVQSAREDAFSSQPQKLPKVFIENNYVDLNSKLNKSNILYGNTDLKDRTLAIFSDGSYAVTLKNDPIHVFYYSQNGILTHVDVKSSLIYPYKTYKYSVDGKLINLSLRVSEDEAFVFNLRGVLLAHWVGEKCYDEFNNVIMTRKIKK